MTLATGPYSVCRVELEEDGDDLIYTTLCWGYCSEEEAIAEVSKIASDHGLSVEDIAVVKTV